MHREDLALCLLTREDYNVTHESAVHRLAQDQALDWRRVFLTAETHRVSPLVHYNIEQSGMLHAHVPAAVRTNFRRAHIHNTLKKKESRRALVALARCCAENRIDLLLVKGAALANFVQRWPWSAISGDIDVILCPRPDASNVHLDAVITFAEHYNHNRSQVSEHIEYELYEHHDVSMNRVLRMTREDLWKGAVPKEVDGWRVWIQSPEMIFIAACINACRKRYFYLKSLNDIATICCAYPNLDWDKIVACARRFRADLVVFTALTVTQITLGCHASHHDRDMFALNRVRRTGIEQSATLLWRRSSLPALSEQHGGLLGRTFSTPLLLTYLSYHWDVLGAKLREVIQAWVNPHPPKPVDDGARPIAHQFAE